MEKGLMCFVLSARGLGDCTNGGLSSKFDAAVLIKNGEELGPFAPGAELPALYVANWYGRMIACPANLETLYPRARNTREDCSIEHLGGWMFGGNYIETSDSRFPNEYPIPIYDRREF